ncbi:9017_t:CDS:2, partial [Racocetra persica]
SPQSRPDVFSKLQPFLDPIPKANEDYYMLFCEIYGKDTSEKYHPSLLQKANVSTSTTTMTIDSLGVNGMGFSPRAQYATNVRILVKYIECNHLTKASPPSFRNDNNCSINNDEVELQDADNDINGDGNYNGDSMEDDERFIDDGDYDGDGMEDGERFNDDGDYDGDGMEDGERFIDE